MGPRFDGIPIGFLRKNRDRSRKPNPKRIGASDMAAIMGISPWSSPWEPWARIVKGFEKPVSEAMLWGVMLEPLLLDYFEHITNLSVERGDTIDHPTRPWQRYTLDGRMRDTNAGTAVVEIKTTSVWLADRWGLSGSADIPEDCMCQVQMYMEAENATIAYVGCLIGGQEFRIFKVPANKPMQGRLIEAAERFWRDHVLTGLPPPTDGHKACGRTLERMHSGPARDPFAREATEAEEALAMELMRAKNDMESAEKRFDLIKHTFEQNIGDDTAIEGPFGKITWQRRRVKNHKTGETEIKRAFVPKFKGEVDG